MSAATCPQPPLDGAQGGPGSQCRLGSRLMPGLRGQLVFPFLCSTSVGLGLRFVCDGYEPLACNFYCKYNVFTECVPENSLLLYPLSVFSFSAPGSLVATRKSSHPCGRGERSRTAQLSCIEESLSWVAWSDLRSLDAAPLGGTFTRVCSVGPASRKSWGCFCLSVDPADLGTRSYGLAWPQPDVTEATWACGGLARSPHGCLPRLTQLLGHSQYLQDTGQPAPPPQHPCPLSSDTQGSGGLRRLPALAGEMPGLLCPSA